MAFALEMPTEDSGSIYLGHNEDDLPGEFELSVKDVDGREVTVKLLRSDLWVLTDGAIRVLSDDENEN